MSVDIAVIGTQGMSRLIGTSVGFVMKYFKLYTEWAVSHSVFSRLGRRLMMEDNLGWKTTYDGRRLIMEDD